MSRVCAEGSLLGQLLTFESRIELTVHEILPRIEIGPELSVKLIVLQHSINKLIVLAFGENYRGPARNIFASCLKASFLPRLMQFNHIATLSLDIKHVYIAILPIWTQALHFIHRLVLNEADVDTLEVLTKVLIRNEECPIITLG